MRRPSPFILTAILACLFCASGVLIRGQTAGQTRGAPGRPPTRGPESGLLGGKGATTRPGSHESSARDERDRIAGKFPAPKEKSDSEEERRTAGGISAAYVDVIALEPQRPAVSLARDDFRVTIDGDPRKVLSVHYVFRGPQALDAARTAPVGKGVIARADESRTIVVVVDETTFPAGAERDVARPLEHVLDVIAPADRAAVLMLPRPGALRFAATRADLLASASRLVGRRQAANGAGAASLDALTRLLENLVKLEGPKNIIYFAALPSRAARRVSDSPDILARRVSAVLDAAAASRAVVHLVTPGEARAETIEPAYLRTLARSTGGIVTRLTGEPHDLAPLASTLLGGYILQIEARATDRDGAAHALNVTTTARSVRLLAPARWMARSDPLPVTVARARP